MFRFRLWKAAFFRGELFSFRRCSWLLAAGLVDYSIMGLDAPSDISFWGTRKPPELCLCRIESLKTCLCLQLIVGSLSCHEEHAKKGNTTCQTYWLFTQPKSCNNPHTMRIPQMTGDTPLGWWRFFSIYCKKRWRVISCCVPPLPPKSLAVSVLQDMTNIDKPPTN